MISIATSYCQLIGFFFLFTACIKLNSRYDVCSEPSRRYGVSADGRQADVAYDPNGINPNQESLAKRLLDAVTDSNEHDIVALLDCVSDDLLCRLQYLHIAAGINHPGKEQKAVIVMRCLLNRCVTLGIIQWALLSKDVKEATPLWVAMQQGSVDMLALLLEYTHKYALLHPELHKDVGGKDYISIALDRYVVDVDNLKSNSDKLLCLLDELAFCNETQHLGSTTLYGGRGNTKCQSMDMLRAILHSHKKTKYPHAVLPFSVANNKIEVLNKLMYTLYALYGKRDGDMELLNLLTKKCFIKDLPFPILLLQVLLDKGQLNKASMGTVNFFVELLSNIDTNTLYILRDNPKVVTRLKASLTEDVCKNMISSIDLLIEEHGCVDFLQVIQSMLRICLVRSHPLQFSSLEVYTRP